MLKEILMKYMKKMPENICKHKHPYRFEQQLTNEKQFQIKYFDYVVSWFYLTCLRLLNIASQIFCFFKFKKIKRLVLIYASKCIIA